MTASHPPLQRKLESIESLSFAALIQGMPAFAGMTVKLASPVPEQTALALAISRLGILIIGLDCFPFIIILIVDDRVILLPIARLRARERTTPDVHSATTKTR